MLERIAGTIPLANHGSLLRAIAHNQAQTAVLGVNQLTTGLFRALALFAALELEEGSGATLLPTRVLPHLPVYELLHSLRLYHDVELAHLRRLEGAFPAGSSALAALREDLDAMPSFLGPLQRELMRRHGLAVGDFFRGDEFLIELLPALRPDLAVLLQPDLFNTNLDCLLGRLGGSLDPGWVAEVRQLLAIPVAIRRWRARAWALLSDPVASRARSFVELALALASLPDPSALQPAAHAHGMPRKTNAARRVLSGDLGDDAVRQLLSASAGYLTSLARHRLEVPTALVRALTEAEKTMRIEEPALTPRQQERLRFCLLQIARLAGDNG